MVESETGIFHWKNPSRTFKFYDEVTESGQAELYFQIDNDTLLHIEKVGENGISDFHASKCSKTDFIDNFKLGTGKFPASEILTDELSDEYKNFKEKYGIELNYQQERAVQTVTGANRILAVPGSGKTTVLISHIGYMVHVKGIDASSILAITYTKKAVQEMRLRYNAKFNQGEAYKVEFRTINALGDEIIRKYCEIKKSERFELIKDNNGFLKRAYFNVNTEYPTESDIKQLAIEVTRRKIGDTDEMVPVTDNFEKIYKEYKALLHKDNKMDYDDQVLYAVNILKNAENVEVLKFFKEKYKYICVDEAQDTSKKAHELIRLLVGDNVFMVGDEDQSIYSFQGAYPRALTSFKDNYKNPYILHMETNYRSYKEIVDKANSFIRRNANRNPKAMFASRGNGGKVTQLVYKSREDEVNSIFEKIKNISKDTAVLYRDSDCAISLIAMLIENNVCFNLKQNSTTFFTNNTVTDILAFIKFSFNPYDDKSFMQIYNKGSVKIKKEKALEIINLSKINGASILDEYAKTNSSGKQFKVIIDTIKVYTPEQAIRYIYGELTVASDIGDRCADELALLARNVADLCNFPKYIDDLRKKIKKISEDENQDNLLSLSTIHSAKGLEFKNVIILDVYEGVIPKNPIYAIEENEDKKDLYQEERRLFYVAMTRAKDNLEIVRREDKSCPFVDEIFDSYKSQNCVLRNRKKQSQPLSYNSKQTIQVRADDKCVCVNGVTYAIGDVVMHTERGEAEILGFSQIGETGRHEVILRLKQNNEEFRFDLEICVMKGIIQKNRY